MRWNGQGELEFRGRMDHQVKVRGYRIEPAEIEHRLRQHPGVRDALVVAREDAGGTKDLVGYVLVDSGATGTEGRSEGQSDSVAMASGEGELVDSGATVVGGRSEGRNASPPVHSAELRAHLQGSLPEYMIPGAFVLLEQWPLTANGKIDRARLPAPDMSTQLSSAYEAPEGEIEERLAQIWQEVLGVERVGRHDNFFELGGHSLIAMRVLTRTKEQWGVDIPVRDFFSSSTVIRFASHIKQAQMTMAAEQALRRQQIYQNLEKKVGSLSAEDVSTWLSELKNR